MMLRQAGLSPATRSLLPQALRPTTAVHVCEPEGNRQAAATHTHQSKDSDVLKRGNRLCVRSCGARAMAAALRDDSQWSSSSCDSSESDSESESIAVPLCPWQCGGPTPARRRRPAGGPEPGHPGHLHHWHSGTGTISLAGWGTSGSPGSKRQRFPHCQWHASRANCKMFHGLFFLTGSGKFQHPMTDLNTLPGTGRILSMHYELERDC